MNKLKLLIAVSLLLSFSYSISAAEIGLLGLTLDVKESGIDVDNVNITIEIYDAETGGNLIYNSTDGFTEKIIKIKVSKYE